MSLRDELIALGLPIPENLPLDRWAARLTDAPCRNTASLVGVSTVLFFIAERDHNPRVNDIYDAMVYCSTCISVGYSDIFARTPIGKIIGSLLMTIGPAMAQRATDGLRIERRDETQQMMLKTLQQILAQLQSSNPAPAPAGAEDESDSA